MVPLTLKLIVSPEAAAAMTDRSVPGEPSSARLVTVSVAAKPGTAALRASRLAASACSAKRLKIPAIVAWRERPRTAAARGREFMSADRERW